jgi:hypothetical protein
MRSLLCLLRRNLDAFSTRDTEHTRYQLCSPRAFVICWDRVHDNARVDIGVNNADGGNMLDGTFTDSMKVRYGIEENDEIRNHAFRQRYLRSKEVDFVCEGTGEPLFTDVVGLRAYALGGLEDGRAKVGTSANKDDSTISRRDGSYKSSCATKMGEGALEIYDCDFRACSIRVWNEVWVKEGSVMTEVCSSSEKSGKCQVARGCWAVQRMMRLPCVVPGLRRTKF